MARGVLIAESLRADANLDRLDLCVDRIWRSDAGVYAGRVFRYPRGDLAGRAAAADHGRAVGVPEEQLDWPA
ncbi:hypothetical protein [Actinopolymorpha pittospori]